MFEFSVDLAHNVMALKGVLYSVFDVDAGPVLRAQSPPGIMTPEVFESVASYIITKPELGGKSVKYLLGSQRLVGMPMCLPGTHFRRNEFLFNLFFAVDATADPLPFERVVRKLNLFLATLEQESSYLSSVESARTIPMLLASVFQKLSQSGSAFCPSTSKHHLAQAHAVSVRAPARGRRSPGAHPAAAGNTARAQLGPGPAPARLVH